MSSGGGGGGVTTAEDVRADSDQRARWSLMFQTALIAAMVLLVAAAAYGGLMIVVDLQDGDGDWDGFGVFIGQIVVGAAFAHLFVMAILTLLNRSGRRRGRPGRVVLAALIAATLSLAWLAWSVDLALQGSDESTVALTALSGSVLLVAAAVTLVAHLPVPSRWAAAWCGALAATSLALFALVTYLLVADFDLEASWVFYPCATAVGALTLGVSTLASSDRWRWITLGTGACLAVFSVFAIFTLNNFDFCDGFEPPEPDPEYGVLVETPCD